MPNTPSGTRMRPTLMPLGWRFTSLISPTGSGIAAICSQPSATVSMILSVETQPIDHRRGQARLLRGIDVLRIGGGERGAFATQQRGQLEQRCVLRGGRRGGHRRGARARRDAELLHQLGNVGGARQRGVRCIHGADCRKPVPAAHLRPYFAVKLAWPSLFALIMKPASAAVPSAGTSSLSVFSA